MIVLVCDGRRDGQLMTTEICIAIAKLQWSRNLYEPSLVEIIKK